MTTTLTGKVALVTAVQEVNESGRGVAVRWRFKIGSQTGDLL
jgi:hypothetical protein